MSTGDAEREVYQGICNVGLKHITGFGDGNNVFVGLQCTDS